MLRDFHYYCIGVLCRAAGFGVEESLAIAHASQYVDDATESSPIPVRFESNRLGFDPVRTAYRGLGTLSAGTWSAQKRVWVPFHFLPPQPFQSDLDSGFDFVVRPDEAFVRKLLERAAGEPDPKRRLCRIGIALHTYADTWAHQDFSGRECTEENDVEDIRVFDGSKAAWIDLLLENVTLDQRPEIGHAEAGGFPDIAFLQWRYQRGKNPDDVRVRNNLREFLAAARAIYAWIRSLEIAPAVLTWEELEPELEDLLGREPEDSPSLLGPLDPTVPQKFTAAYLDERCEEWRQRFGNLFPEPDRFHYDRQEWRREALEGDADWEAYSESDWQREPPRNTRSGFWDSFWVHFHRAALRQRHRVLENLP